MLAQCRRAGCPTRRIGGAVHTCGCGTMRMQGSGDFQPPGKRSLASASWIAGGMITSSPCFQLTGVATFALVRNRQIRVGVESQDPATVRQGDCIPPAIFIGDGDGRARIPARGATGPAADEAVPRLGPATKQPDQRGHAAAGIDHEPGGDDQRTPMAVCGETPAVLRVDQMRHVRRRHHRGSAADRVPSQPRIETGAIEVPSGPIGVADTVGGCGFRPAPQATRGVAGGMVLIPGKGQFR